MDYLSLSLQTDTLVLFLATGNRGICFKIGSFTCFGFCTKLSSASYTQQLKMDYN